MKKLIALMLAFAMIATFAACGTTEQPKEDNTDPAETTTGTADTTDGTETPENILGEPEDETHEPVQDTTTANDIMDYVWGKIADDKKPMVIGGHYSAEFTGAPNTYELAYVDELATTLLIPEEQLDSVTDASTAVHMMNANTMTLGLVKLHEGTDMKAFADGVHNKITNNQWMCGFPEKVIVAQVHNDYVLIAFGTAELLDTFKTELDASWSTSDFYNEAL